MGQMQTSLSRERLGIEVTRRSRTSTSRQSMIRWRILLIHQELIWTNLKNNCNRTTTKALELHSEDRVDPAEERSLPSRASNTWRSRWMARKARPSQGTPKQPIALHKSHKLELLQIRGSRVQGKAKRGKKQEELLVNHELSLQNRGKRCTRA